MKVSSGEEVLLFLCFDLGVILLSQSGKLFLLHVYLEWFVFGKIVFPFPLEGS